MITLSSHTLTTAELMDKIRGGWTGKSYGCMMGEPMEFEAQGEIYEGSLEIQPEAPTKWLHNEDDLYVNMAFLEVMRDKGMDATIDDFAKVFRDSKFMLWHANGQARQNIREGIAPGLSGHPYYNPHADDIDFQIECDFIGLICPGLPQAAQDISDRVGHLMNYGEGYYAGVFLAALYSAAFIETDLIKMIRMAQKTIPADSDYSAMLNDLLKWYEAYPDDWRTTWRKLEEKWNHDLCPWARTEAGRFNIQGHFNGAYIVMGLLYGQGDYLESISICTRCGQDTDSNVGNCGGIMGALIGYESLPQTVKDELDPYMDREYNFTSLSINSASVLCYELALQNIQKSGGTVEDGTAAIAVQPYGFDGEREVSFIDFRFSDVFRVDDPALKRHGEWRHDPEWIKKHELIFSSTPGNSIETSFTGSCVYMQANLHSEYGIVDIYIDGELVQSRDLYIDPQWDNCAQSTAVWVTGMEDTWHTLKAVVSGRKNDASGGVGLALGRVVSYRGKVAALPGE